MARSDDDGADGRDSDAESVYDTFLHEVARTDAEPTQSERAIGSHIGRFVLRSELGRGGMGIVYRAHDPTLGRSVALKVIASRGERDPQTRARFLREARSAASIVHPNVATIYEIGEAEASLFIAMELVPGESLRARFAAGRPLPVDEVMAIANGIARGLAAAHAQGIVHRDLKPENVMVDHKGLLKILDFGLAKLREAPRDVLEQQPTDAVPTADGQLLGTPAYMSPEQTAGKPLDARSDLFSLGVVLYEALTGGRPFSGETSFETLAAVLRDTPAPIRSVNPEVPADLAALVTRCLAKTPGGRPASADELLEDLAGFEKRAAPTSHARSRALVGAFVIALLIGAGALALSRDRTSTLSQPAPSASAPDAAVDRGIAMTDLALDEKPNAEAERLYHEGMQEFRADVSGDKLDQAAALDASFAAASLQSAFWHLGFGGEREPYVKAVHLRDKLGERDRAFLDALAPCFLPEHSDTATCGARLEATSRKYPRDAELALAVGTVSNLRGDFHRELAADARAIELDPRFARAIGDAAMAAAYLGRYDDAQRLVEQSIAESPNSGSAFQIGLQLADQRGDRVQFARYAHMAGLHGIPMGFTDSLLLEGAGREAVLAAIAPTKKRLPEPLRAQSSDLDQAALDVLDGDFSSSAARLRRVYDDLVASRYADRWLSVSLLVAGLRESGDPAGAARVATQLRNRLPGLPKDLATDDLALTRDPLPFLVDAQYRGASITREQRDAARSEWLARWKETVIGAGYLPYVWWHGYAAHVETAEEANEALAALPAWGGLPPFPQYTAANYSLGRMYLLAGRRDEALRYLKLAAKSCSPFEIPFEFVRSHLYLGIALADSGDKAGACDELAEVVKRWGNAKPKSVSAIDAKKRASALGCP